MKVDPKKTAVLIPLRIDSESRLQNLLIVVRFLKRYLEVEVIVLEADAIRKVPDEILDNCTYYFVEDTNPVFWRTKYINELIYLSKADHVMIYDADVIVNPLAMREAFSVLASKCYSFVLPYNGRFLSVDRYTKAIFGRSLEMAVLDQWADFFSIMSGLSVGGCFALDVVSYRQCGMENQNIKGWGHDDVERVKRVRKLGFEVFRIDGALYHLYHDRGVNSNFFDMESAVGSFNEYFTICASTPVDLYNRVKCYPWIR